MLWQPARAIIGACTRLIRKTPDQVVYCLNLYLRSSPSPAFGLFVSEALAHDRSTPRSVFRSDSNPFGWLPLLAKKDPPC